MKIWKNFVVGLLALTITAWMWAGPQENGEWAAKVVKAFRAEMDK